MTSAIPHALPATLGTMWATLRALVLISLVFFFAEATCVALVLVASSNDLQSSWKTLMYPVLISSLGIVVGIVTLTLSNHLPSA